MANDHQENAAALRPHAARQRRHTLKRTRLRLNVASGGFVRHTIRERANQISPGQEANQVPLAPLRLVRGLQDTDERVRTELVVRG